jgi:hypothetical protein
VISRRDLSAVGGVSHSPKEIEIGVLAPIAEADSRVERL